MTCPNCGASDSQVIPVWKHDDKRRDGDHPKYIACESCRRLIDLRLTRDEEDETPPQAPLTDHERRRLAAKDAVGNQNNEKLTIIEWQCVKGAAVYYGVSDWTSKADPTLTKEENVSLMERYGTRNKETSLRMMKTP